MMKHVKKVLLLSLLAVLTVLPSGPVHAASKKSSALKAYRKFLSGNTITGSGWRSAKMDKCSFALAYVDSDSVPELVLYSNGQTVHAEGSYLLYTYRSGKVRFIANLSDGFVYYKKKGLYGAIHSGTGGYETRYYKYARGKETYTLYSQDETRSRYDFNRDGKIAINYRSASGKIISAKSFNKQLKKIVGSRKVTTLKKMYKNTAGNRKKILK